MSHNPLLMEMLARQVRREYMAAAEIDRRIREAERQVRARGGEATTLEGGSHMKRTIVAKLAGILAAALAAGLILGVALGGSGDSAPASGGGAYTVFVP